MKMKKKKKKKKEGTTQRIQLAINGRVVYLNVYRNTSSCVDGFMKQLTAAMIMFIADRNVCMYNIAQTWTLRILNILRADTCVIARPEEKKD